uniref:Uncharacterized protein n=1 Tax=Cucumis melo TaxID=3656 RepID=A0A9I9ED05_CUCME
MFGLQVYKNFGIPSISHKLVPLLLYFFSNIDGRKIKILILSMISFRRLRHRWRCMFSLAHLLLNV